MKNKFKVGDKVVHIIHELYTEPCNICDNSGEIILKKEKFKCPKCDGLGIMKTHKKWKVDEEYGLSKIEKIETVEGKVYAVFSKAIYEGMIEGTHYTHRYVPINYCFSSIKEAQNKCNKLNKKL